MTSRVTGRLAWAALLLASTLPLPGLADDAVHLPALRLALLPFEDRAGFQGDWELSRDVPSVLRRHLERKGVFRTVPMDTVALALKKARGRGAERAAAVGRALAADLVVTGIVKKCGVRRFTAGDPNLGGYKSYNYLFHLDEVDLIRVATGQIVQTFSVQRDSVERPVGLNLFGRPRRQDQEFRALFKVAFGSEEFRELPFGGLVDEAFADISSQITRALVARRPIDLSGDQARVLAAEGADVYLGIGSEDHVEYGDVLPLYRDQTRVALVEIYHIIGPHLCKGRILEQSQAVEIGLRPGQRLTRAVQEEAPEKATTPPNKEP